MAVLFHDLIKGNEATLTIEGWQINRTAIVNKITGVYGYAKIIEATRLLNLEGAYIGAPHPAWPTATIRNINPVSLSNDTVEFSLIYKENPPVQIICNTSLSQESTNIDALGMPIRVKYTYPADYKDPNTGLVSQLAGTTSGWQSGTVMKYIPEISFSYSRVETITGMALIAKQKEYVGKINAAGWMLEGVSQEQNRWLCTGIVGDSNDGGINYQVTYSFAYRKGSLTSVGGNIYSGWRPFVVFTTPDGKPVSDAWEDPIQYDALKDFPLYEVVNFNPLNIV